MTQYIENSIVIDSKTDTVWETLTQPSLMKKWMGELEIYTNWKVNSPVVMTGFHHIKFENKGILLGNQPNNRLVYSHLSSISELPDDTDNYTILDFLLTSLENRTKLTLTIKNFPTETIFKHLEFYWQITLVIIKKIAEEQTFFCFRNLTQQL
jgi:uncharacterized protein YndB with AHSA1/START domain